MSQTVYIRYRGKWVPATILPDSRRVIDARYAATPGGRHA